MRRFFRFFKRQYRTKTGKASMTTIAGATAAVIAGTVTPAAVVTPVVMAVLAMFLRDGEAKKEERDGE